MSRTVYWSRRRSITAYRCATRSRSTPPLFLGSPAPVPARPLGGGGASAPPGPPKSASASLRARSRLLGQPPAPDAPTAALDRPGPRRHGPLPRGAHPPRSLAAQPPASPRAAPTAAAVLSWTPPSSQLGGSLVECPLFQGSFTDYTEQINLCVICEICGSLGLTRGANPREGFPPDRPAPLGGPGSSSPRAQPRRAAPRSQR